MTSNALSADIVLINGWIYTVDAAQPWAEAVAIEDGRFVYVGDAEGVKEFVDAIEQDGAKVVYAGRIAVNALQSSQIPQVEWYAFILAQYPSRRLVRWHHKT